MATETAPVTILPVQPFTMHCANRHQWTEHWPVPCRLDAWAARGLAAAACPSCGAKTFLGPARAP